MSTCTETSSLLAADADTKKAMQCQGAASRGFLMVIRPFKRVGSEMTCWPGLGDISQEEGLTNLGHQQQSFNIIVVPDYSEITAKFQHELYTFRSTLVCT